MDLGFQCQRWSEIRKQRTSLHHRLLSRNTQGLWVVADAEDEGLFTTALPDLLPCSTTLQTHIAPKLLYLSSNEDTTAVSPQGETFIAWSRALLAEKGFAPANLMVVRRRVEADAPDQAVRAEMVVGQHGVIVLGRRGSQPWRARLLYRARGKVMVLAGSHPNRHRIMVPVDLSDATGLILAFLQQTYVGKPGVVLHFVHVTRRPDPSVEKKWQAWLNLVEMGDAPPLEVVAAAGGVAERLLALVQKGAFGTVIMGKRGLSGIKKWMLGSVSQGVLNGLHDQTLFLID
jgi:2,4-dienoyl-CoA reductase (NADPH2)